MKKLIMLTMIVVCLVLRAAVWPKSETVRETPEPTQETTVSTPEAHAVMRKEGTEDLSQTEKGKANPPQPELPMEAVPEPEPAPTEMPVVPQYRDRP